MKHKIRDFLQDDDLIRSWQEEKTYMSSWGEGASNRGALCIRRIVIWPPAIQPRASLRWFWIWFWDDLQKTWSPMGRSSQIEVQVEPNLREECREKSVKSLVFCQTGGVGGSKKSNLYFGKVFFQWACRIILGPPKHAKVWGLAGVSEY